MGIHRIIIISVFVLSLLFCCSLSKKSEKTAKPKLINPIEEHSYNINQPQINKLDDYIPEPELVRNYPDNTYEKLLNEYSNIFLNTLFYPNKRKGKPIDSFIAFDTYYVNEGNALQFLLYLEEGRKHIITVYSNSKNIQISIQKTKPLEGSEEVLQSNVSSLKNNRYFHVGYYNASENGEYKIYFKIGSILKHHSINKGFFLGEASVYTKPGESYYEGFYRIKKEYTGEE